MLECAAEHSLVDVERRIEIDHGMPDMMDLESAHGAEIVVDGRERTGSKRRETSMGLLDKVKQQATDIASTVVEKTQETAKTGQLQMQLRNLKGELKDAQAEVGKEIHRLHKTGDLGEVPPSVQPLLDKSNDIEQKVSDKEAEIAAASKTEAEAGTATGETVDGTAEEVSDADAAPADPEPPAGESESTS